MVSVEHFHTGFDIRVCFAHSDTPSQWKKYKVIGDTSLKKYCLSVSVLHSRMAVILNVFNAAQNVVEFKERFGVFNPDLTEREFLSESLGVDDFLCLGGFSARG